MEGGGGGAGRLEDSSHVCMCAFVWWFERKTEKTMFVWMYVYLHAFMCLFMCMGMYLCFPECVQSLNMLGCFFCMEVLCLRVFGGVFYLEILTDRYWSDSTSSFR